MPLFTRRISYDRRRLFERAEALENTRRWRHALRLYRQILAAEPGSTEVHVRVAPLLARAGRATESWASYRIAADSCRSAGDAGGLRSLLVEAVRMLPLCPEAYVALSEVELARQRRNEAIRVLLTGSRRLARKRRRGEAILLLRAARELDAWHPPTVLALARLVARDGLPGEALFLLDYLDDRVDADDRRTVRALTFRIEPSLRHGWRWFRSARDAGGVWTSRSSQAS